MEIDKDLQDRIRGCLVGVAIGDAFGMPWEMCTHEEIQEITGGHGVTGLMDMRTSRKTEILPELARLKLGETTDDWQLTKAVATSLIRCKGFDIYDQAAAHVDAFMQSTVGWDEAAKTSVAELKQWFRSFGRDGRRPTVPAPRSHPAKHVRNTTMMKIAPVSCLFAILRKVGGEKRCSFYQVTAADLTRMVYDTPIRRETGCLGEIIQRILDDQSQATSQLAFYAKFRRGFFNFYEPLDDLFLKDYLPFTREQGLNATYVRPEAKIIREKWGASSLASESALFSVATFLRNPTDFHAAVLEAINAGGGTDTNASIVGALTGANVGLKGIPAEWVEQVPSAREAINVADQLIATFSK